MNDAEARARRSNRGCWIALLVTATLGLLVAVVGGILVHRAIRDSGLGDIAAAVGEGVDIFVDAQTAPGAKALRAAGCRDGMVFDVRRILKLLERLDAGVPPGGSTGLPRQVAVCQLERGGSAPSCAQLAKRYLGSGAKPGGDFAVLVAEQGGSARHQCGELYSSGGKHLGSFDGRSVPLPSASGMPSTAL